MRRRGVTLLELMLVLCLLGLVGVMVSAMVMSASRIGSRAVGHLAAERTAQVAAAFLRHEFAEGVWRDVTVADDAIGMTRRVGEASVCEARGVTLWLRRSSWTGERAPAAARDWLELWPDDASGAVREAILDVSSASCPDAAPAWRITRGTAGSIAAWLRVVEPVTMRRYRSGSTEWLGLTDGGAPVQPFAGPLVVGASRFARIGGAVQVDLVTGTGGRGLTIPLGAGP